VAQKPQKNVRSGVSAAAVALARFGAPWERRTIGWRLSAESRYVCKFYVFFAFFAAKLFLCKR